VCKCGLRTCHWYFSRSLMISHDTSKHDKIAVVICTVDIIVGSEQTDY
jgi:hypothetical protein